MFLFDFFLLEHMRCDAVVRKSGDLNFPTCSLENHKKTREKYLFDQFILLRIILEGSQA